MRVTHKLECPIDEAEIQNAKDALARQTVEYNRLADEEKERAAKARADLKARDAVLVASTVMPCAPLPVTRSGAAIKLGTVETPPKALITLKLDEAHGGHHVVVDVPVQLARRCSLAGAPVRWRVTIEPEPDLNAIGETGPQHFSRVPFVAACGANVPNQRTTNDVHRVDCPACLEQRLHADGYPR